MFERIADTTKELSIEEIVELLNTSKEERQKLKADLKVILDKESKHYK